MAVQGAFYWAGVKALLNASYSLSHGVTPGIATLAIPPQPTGIALAGTLSIRFGSTAINFPDCRVIKCDFHADQSGKKFWLLHIADGRWRWRYGVINGYFNRRLSNGLLDETSKKKPRELAKLLADAIGITKFDASLLPNDSFPFIDWEWKERPDTLLASLLDTFSCRLAYNCNGSVRVVKVGVGAPLPKQNAIDYQLGIDPGEAPESLVFVAGRSQWNVDMKLEPIGEELSGKLEKLEDLSYTPFGNGWMHSDPPRFMCLNGKKLQQQAQKCVFRWYRPKMPLKVGPHTAKELWQILPMTGYQVIPTDNFGFVAEYSKDNFLTQPPWVYGSWLKGHDDGKPTTINVAGNLVDVANGILTTGFGIDTERGIVQFAMPMYLYDKEGWRIPADLTLRAAVSFRDAKTRQFEHWKTEMKLPNGTKGVKPRYIVKEEIAYRKGKDIAAGKLDGKEWDNLKDLTSLSLHYLLEAKAEYDTQVPEVATLPGFVNVQLDGALQSVRWWVGDDGRPFTQVTRNTEQMPSGLSWSDRRFYEDVTREIFDGHRNARRQPV